MRLIFASEERLIAGRLDMAEREATMWSARYDDLMERYHALKAAGAAPATTPTKRPTDRVLEVISDVAGSNAPLRGMLGRYARQQRAAKVDDDQIIQTLMHWPDADEEAEA